MIDAVMKLSIRIRDALDRVRRFKARRRAVQELRRSLALIVDLGALETNVASHVRELFDPDLLVILQLDPVTADYRPSFCWGVSQEELKDVALPANGRLAQWFRVNETCLLDRNQGVIAYIGDDDRRLLERLNARICAPLLARNHLVGVMVLGSTRPWRPGRRDGDLLLQLANQASLAFQNAVLYRDLRKRLDRLHRADRLAAIGQLAAGVAHEVNNPLTSIRSTMQYLAGSLEDTATQQLVADLIGDVDRIGQTINNLLSLTRTSDFKPEDVDLFALIRQTLRLIENKAREQSVSIEERLESPLNLQADDTQLRQLVLNLILNAIQAMVDGGHITVSAKRELLEQVATPTRERAQIRLEIADNGPGIPADQAKAVFDPFFTTKSEGTGLGLAICHGIVQRHAGEIELDSTLGQGTTVSILLPVKPFENRAKPDAPPPGDTAHPSPSGGA